MDPVRPPASLELIEALATLRPDRRAGRRASHASTPGEAMPALREQLRQIATSMTSTDEPSYMETRSRLLHCILGAQWGEGQAADPLYRGVVTAIENEMRGNPQLDVLFRRAIEELMTAR
jgi:hypothetical protein